MISIELNNPLSSLPLERGRGKNTSLQKPQYILDNIHIRYHLVISGSDIEIKY